jgi:ribonuclease VapC
MIIDSSAIIAILKKESDAEKFLREIDQAERCLLAAPTYLEVCMVWMGSVGEDGRKDVDNLVSNFDILVVPFSYKAADFAVRAFAQYGKGQGHQAQLNFGDCISYALAKMESMPLLFKGNDFRHTDVGCAV